MPPDRVFFVDRDLGRKIFPGILGGAGLRVEVHSDHFDPDAPDVAWLPTVAARGWVVLSNDRRIMRRPLKREAVRSSGATLLVLIGGDVPAPQCWRLGSGSITRARCRLAFQGYFFVLPFFDPCFCERLLPAADLDFLLVRPSRRVFEAALAASFDVTFFVLL